jgi:hypothetical protein
MNKNNNEYINKLYFIRGSFVMLDRDLAFFYDVETKIFNKAMNRKKESFEGSVFQLTKEEYQEILVKNQESRSSAYLPIAYTEKAASPFQLFHVGVPTWVVQKSSS